MGLLLVLVLGLAGCGNRADSIEPKAIGTPAKLAGRISEVSPPAAIQELRQALEAYQPQVAIVSPRPDQVIEDEQVSVQFRVQDLPLFKDQDLGLGPHLHVFLDNQPYIAVYDANEPLVLKDLAPGTHTIRAFASRPWHESFKNEGAYAQTTFHVFAKTPTNNPDPAQPLLTYSRPQSSYGAQPIMLDFYLTNAPLHLIAQEDADDDISDWRVRCTIDGESFVFDRWQPIYIKGLKPGKNWVQLELLNEKGEAIDNVFNNTVRIVNYEPGGSDTLSKLVRGDLAAAEARGIVDKDYKPEVLTPAAPAPVPTPEPESEPLPKPSPVEIPEPSLEPAVVPSPIPPIIEPIAPVDSIAPTNATKGFFNRFRRPAMGKAPSETIKPVAPDAPTPELNEPALNLTEPKDQPQTEPSESAPAMGEAWSESIEPDLPLPAEPEALPSQLKVPSQLEDHLEPIDLEASPEPAENGSIELR